MKQKILSLIAILSICSAANAQVSNTQADFSCPGQVTVTYDLVSTDSVNITLYYSPNKCDWLIATTVTGDLFAQTTGTDKTIIWNNYADNVRFGKFYFKVEVPSGPCPDVPACVVINGRCWATRNVNTPGTFTPCPEDFGMFYQWGSNVGWSSTDPLAATDGLHVWRDLCEYGSVWLPENDPCPEGWRVPTRWEIQSLSSSINYWGNLNGVDGQFFGDGQLFLPAAGNRSTTGGLGYVGYGGLYWSSTEFTGFNSAYLLVFPSGGSVGNKILGFSIRCVEE